VGFVADGLRRAEENDVFELNECWTYVRKRSNKRWLWVALCRRTRQVVAFVIGDRSAKTCARLWNRIPEDYHQAKTSATSGSSIVQCLRMIPVTSKSESPVASSPTWSAFSVGFGRSWPGTSDGRERPPNQKSAPPDHETIHGVVQ
jgi:hypothetical protein